MEKRQVSLIIWDTWPNLKKKATLTFKELSRVRVIFETFP